MADIFERHGARPAREPGRKIGEGTLGRMARLGLDELRNASGQAARPAAEEPSVRPPTLAPRPERSR